MEWISYWDGKRKKDVEYIYITNVVFSKKIYIEETIIILLLTCITNIYIWSRTRSSLINKVLLFGMTNNNDMKNRWNYMWSYI